MHEKKLKWNLKKNKTEKAKPTAVRACLKTTIETTSICLYSMLLLR